MADKRISQLIERTDIANNDVLPIVASGATTTNKVTISTIQDWMQDNLDVGVTSVGLSVPSAFTVSGSPVTTSGNITISGAGTTAQYIRGDGSLADFPSISGGGSSISYYLNGSVSQGTIGGVAYRELSKVPILGAGTDITINADGYIASFITDAGDPSLLEIPGGNWNFETYFQASSGGGSPTFYVELYKVSAAGTATLIATSSGSPELIAFGTNTTPYFSSLAVPTTTLTLTDRLAIRYYVAHSGRTITLHTENNTLCQIITTFTTGLTALNGLTAQVQNFATGLSGTDFNISSASTTHTFNLPDASASNRGVVTTGTQTIAGIKTFTSTIRADVSVLLAQAGTALPTDLRNISGTGLTSSGSNGFGFNSGNNIYFSGSDKGGGIISFSNTGNRTYTLQNASGTLAFTSDLGAYLPLAGGTLTGALNGVNASFTSTISSQDRISTDTIFSVKHNSTIFTLNGYNSIQGNLNSFAVYNGTKGMRINFPSNESFTHTLPDASGTIALTSNLSAYLPLTGGTLTGALGGTSLNFSGDIQTATRLISATGGQQILINANNGGSTNRVESVGTLPLSLVSAAAITLAAGGTTPQITLASSGAVTLTGALSGTSASFSSSVTGSQLIANGNSAGGFEGLRIVNASTGAAQIVLNNSAQSWLVNTRTDNQFSIFNATASTTPFLISTTGAATFSSSVTATQFNTGNGSLRNSGFWGTTLIAGSGSYSNFALLDSATNGIMFNPTGTLNMAFSGNVGIGTSSPATRLQVQDSSNTYSVHFSGQNQTNGIAIGTNSSNVAVIQGYTRTFSATNNIAMQVDGGNVGIGTASPSVLLHSSPASTANLVTALFTQGSSDTNFKAGFANGSGTANATEHSKVGMWYGTSGNPVTHIGFLRGNSADSIGMTFNVNNSEMMRITSGGSLLVGTTSDNGARLQINGIISQNNYTYHLNNDGGNLNGSTWITTGITLPANHLGSYEVYINGNENGQNQCIRIYNIFYNMFTGWGAVLVSTNYIGNDYGWVDLRMTSGGTIQVKAGNNVSTGIYRISLTKQFKN